MGKAYWWSVRILALAAAVIAGYLLMVSLAAGSAPAGCGADSPCQTVLSSSWSRVLGAPVSALALAAYLAVLAATALIGAGRLPEVLRAGWAALNVLAGAILTAAIWFTGLQAFLLHAYCPWCLADHVLGVALAVLIFAGAVRRPTREGGWPLRASLASGLLGAALAGSLILGQAALPPQPGELARIAAARGGDTGPGPQRRITLAQGQLEFNPHEEPVLGSPDAPHLLVVFFDYCCSHCRKMHVHLLEALERYGDQLGVVLVPVPLDRDCNWTIERTDPRFDQSCELARLALAIWQIDREKFAEFDEWLFASETPRRLSEAQQRAEELVDRAQLERAFSHPQMVARLGRNVRAHADSEGETIPLIMSPQIPSIVGPTTESEQLFDVLEKELGLSPTKPGSAGPGPRSPDP